MIDILLDSAALAATFALGVVLTWRLRHAADAGAAHHAAFLQSPHGMLLVDAQTLSIADANPALVRSVGIPLTESVQNFVCEA